VLHPNIWTIHSPTNVLAGFADHCPPGPADRQTDRRLAGGAADRRRSDPWRPRLGAPDGTILDVPILLGAFSAEDAVAGGTTEQLAGMAAAVLPDVLIQEQLLAAADGHRPGRYGAVARRITSVPGEFARLLRGEVYRQLDYPEPAFLSGCSRWPWPPRRC
jgi:hypothetical protein